MSEAGFQGAVIDLAHIYGWRVAHFRAAHTAKGWRTPVAADGKGFPDLLLAHPIGGVLFRELKDEKGRLTPDQIIWGEVLVAAGADYAVWRPIDFNDIHKQLNHRRRSHG